MTTVEKPTFKSQLFSGFFLVFWALCALFALLAIISGIRYALYGRDLGVGPWYYLFLAAVVIAAIPVLVNLFNREARAARNG